jgi:hypothetical protein
MVRWSWSRAGFRLISDDLLAPIIINRTEVLARIIVPEMSLEQLVSQEPTETPASAGRPVRRGARIQAPIEFALSLKAYVDKMSGACSFGGHRDHEESSEDEKETEK